MKINYESRKNCLIEVFEDTPYRHYFENNEIRFYKIDGSKMLKKDYKNIQKVIDKFDPLYNVRRNAKLRVVQILQDEYEEKIKELNKNYYICGFEELELNELFFSGDDEPQILKLSRETGIPVDGLQDYINSYVTDKQELVYQLLGKKLSLMHFIDNSTDIDAIAQCSIPEQK